MLIKKVISGGQTGVDRAALDAAIAAGIGHGGWIPKGRWAEDGPLTSQYNLIETPEADVEQRTEWNVRDSDATLLIASAPLAGGTALTENYAHRYLQPCLHVDPRRGPPEVVAREIEAWLSGVDGEILNIAGPRASEDAEIYGLAYAVLVKLFSRG